MTKRIRAKHKVDRRLKLTYGENPRVHLNQKLSTWSAWSNKKENLLIMVFNYMPNKNLNHTTEILMKDNLEMFIGLQLKKRVTQLKTWLVF